MEEQALAAGGLGMHCSSPPHLRPHSPRPNPSHITSTMPPHTAQQQQQQHPSSLAGCVQVLAPYLGSWDWAQLRRSCREVRDAVDASVPKLLRLHLGPGDLAGLAASSSSGGFLGHPRRQSLDRGSSMDAPTMPQQGPVGGDDDSGFVCMLRHAAHAVADRLLGAHQGGQHASTSQQGAWAKQGPGSSQLAAVCAFLRRAHGVRSLQLVVGPRPDGGACSSSSSSGSDGSGVPGSAGTSLAGGLLRGLRRSLQHSSAAPLAATPADLACALQQLGAAVGGRLRHLTLVCLSAGSSGTADTGQVQVVPAFSPAVLGAIGAACPALEGLRVVTDDTADHPLGIWAAAVAQLPGCTLTTLDLHLLPCWRAVVHREARPQGIHSRHVVSQLNRPPAALCGAVLAAAGGGRGPGRPLVSEQPQDQQQQQMGRAPCGTAVPGLPQLRALHLAWPACSNALVDASPLRRAGPHLRSLRLHGSGGGQLEEGQLRGLGEALAGCGPQLTYLAVDLLPLLADPGALRTAPSLRSLHLHGAEAYGDGASRHALLAGVCGLQGLRELRVAHAMLAWLGRPDEAGAPRPAACSRPPPGLRLLSLTSMNWPACDLEEAQGLIEDGWVGPGTAVAVGADRPWSLVHEIPCALSLLAHHGAGLAWELVDTQGSARCLLPACGTSGLVAAAPALPASAPGAAPLAPAAVSVPQLSSSLGLGGLERVSGSWGSVHGGRAFCAVFSRRSLHPSSSSCSSLSRSSGSAASLGERDAGAAGTGHPPGSSSMLGTGGGVAGLGEAEPEGAGFVCGGLVLSWHEPVRAVHTLLTPALRTVVLCEGGERGGLAIPGKGGGSGTGAAAPTLLQGLTQLLERDELPGLRTVLLMGLGGAGRGVPRAWVEGLARLAEVGWARQGLQLLLLPGSWGQWLVNRRLVCAVQAQLSRAPAAAVQLVQWGWGAQVQGEGQGEDMPLWGSALGSACIC